VSSFLLNVIHPDVLWISSSRNQFRLTHYLLYNYLIYRLQFYCDFIAYPGIELCVGVRFVGLLVCLRVGLFILSSMDLYIR
jgi:hypothetical protein